MMARINALGVPAAPKERNYEESPAGAMRYTADVLEWMVLYTDTTDDHRKANVGLLGYQVADHEADLQRDTAKNPGWIAHMFAQVAEDNAALLKDNQAIRKQLKWQNGLVLSTLLAMLVFLGQQLIVRL